MHALAEQAIPLISEFEAQRLVRIAWAFAQLLIPNKHLLQAIASEALRKITEFIASEIENMAWALAALYFRHAPLFAAISASALRTIHQAAAADVTSLAWSFARLRLHDSTLLAAIAASAIRTITELGPQGFANLAWSWSALAVEDPPLRDAIAAEALRKLGDFAGEAQYLVMLADVGLEGAEPLERAAESLPERVFGESLAGLDSWPGSGLLPFCRAQPLRSLGSLGTRALFQRLRLPPASADFCAEAAARIGDAQASLPQPWPDEAAGDLLVEKTWTFIRYDLAVAIAIPEDDTGGTISIHGEVLKDNGYKHSKVSAFLRPSEMYVYEWVDRAQCGEYQALAAVCEALGRRLDLRAAGARAAARGRAEAYVLSPPCLSCVSCFRQFQLLFPNVELYISIGSASATAQRFLIRV